MTKTEVRFEKLGDGNFLFLILEDGQQPLMVILDPSVVLRVQLKAGQALGRIETPVAYDQIRAGSDS